MCTLTFTGPGLKLGGFGARSAGGSYSDGDPSHPDGYQVWFNRDELRSRGPESPPSLVQTPSGIRYLAPTDSDAGGTWIAVNEFGITVALLNGYLVSKGPDRDVYTSRGALVRSLAALTQITDIWPRLTPALLREYRSLVLCILIPGERPAVIRWDGRDVMIDLRGDRQMPLTSSSFEQDEVQEFRRRLYRETVTGPASGGPPRASDLARFHAYAEPGGPTGLTPNMARSDAATRSHCAIHVCPEGIEFSYLAGPPSLGAAVPDPAALTVRLTGSATKSLRSSR